ncbi:MAG: SPOR domain-containing protein [Alphaproteobacteria bacterium]|nr:SPOR domain-containing protein [Alphaproteobacteria bacterium]MDE2340754.1 SPOR domain-containing protein [Alphaproteobacteria bacterium]
MIEQEDEDELHLQNEVHPHEDDRLPWLEAVEPDADHLQAQRNPVTGVLVAGAAALALVVGGLWWMNSQTPPAKGGDGKLIAAQDGDYKTKPADAGGMQVEGQGGTAAATAQGAAGNGQIDNSAQAETPIKPAETRPAPAAPAAKPNAAAKIDESAAPAAKPAPAAATAAPGTGLIQLGAYGSESSAKQGWDDLKGKYPFLASMTQSIVPATVGGATVYRLRASAGNAAADTCAKLKAAGANCIIAH